ncbi:DNA-directed RNA polymerases I and III subunit RPAC2 [Tripterygium wilfordii]|uniref:DNA-directed RNA polymerases I and III subunit RPAC2 n=2 Tax=Tripterygium wilfordii TaxID=458696 RepID=A0A7J7DEP3_TRIWF|nr:DNA-directed RNA polymerases I and III subunit RPAC2 [Tripterygium wilfordii]
MSCCLVPGSSMAAEHGTLADPTSSTFSLIDEDHTLANSVRFTLNQDPRVSFCGYSIPHPSDAKVNIRVQTTGDPAREVMQDACQDLMLICQHVRSTFDEAVADFKMSQPMETMEIK